MLLVMESFQQHFAVRHSLKPSSKTMRCRLFAKINFTVHGCFCNAFDLLADTS
jgi:hypothetical protein